MSTSILATKLYLPTPRAKIVPRPRLLKRLDEGLDGKLTLVSAPAGFGKTTLVSEWVSGCERPVAWLSLDEGDNDPTRFLAYLIAALQTVAAQLGEGIPGALHAPQPPTEAVLTVLLNRVAAVPDPFVLVLDDYHVLDARAVDDALTFLLEHQPPQMHLVIATREDPPLPLARLRARGQLSELRAADLRFTPAEAADFLGGVMGLDLSSGDVAVLETRTEGWIAGLQLAALSVQGRADTAEFFRAFTGSHRFVLDYLVEEVLQRQPERVRSFLLQTAILGSLSGPLCDAVTGGGEGREMLETLERSNLFVVPLDDKRLWYRYHHLFAEVLQARLRAEQPGRVPDLHRRASVWFEQNGLPADAIRHALAAGDFARAAGLVELEARVTLMGRREETFLGWLKALPDALIDTRPVLGVYYALALLTHDLVAAEARLRAAERFLDGAAQGGRPGTPGVARVVVAEAELRSLPGIAAIIRAYYAGALGDVPGSVRHALRALELLPEDEPLWRGAVTVLLALAQWSGGDLEASYRSFTDGMASLRAAGDLTQSNSGAFILANIRVAQGRLREAASIYEEALRRASDGAGQGGPVAPGTADLHVGMSELCYEQNDLEAASQHLLTGKALGEHSGITENRHRWYIAAARVREARGDLSGAERLLEEAERRYLRSPDPDVRPVGVLKARIWLRQGRLAEVLAWARERGLSADDDLSYMREFEHVTLARALIVGYRRDRVESSVHDAMRLLERLLQAAESARRTGSVLEILVVQALAFEARGDVPAALGSLARALALAEPESYVRVFVDEGVPMAHLLSEAVTRGPTRTYADRVLAAFGTDGQTNKDKLFPPPGEALLEPLSQRELEVLRLIAQGRSNREISERLFRSLDTIKGHNRMIFSKLGVQSRTEAVARARELGLL